jgi:predicted PurR-regulated permease PerM
MTTDPPLDVAPAKDAAAAERSERDTWTERLAKTVLAVAVLIVGYLVLRAIAPVMAPVLVSLLLAYFLDPVIDTFERRRINRSLAIIVVAGGALGALVALVVVIVPTVAAELRDSVVDLPGALSERYASLKTLLLERFDIDIDARLREASSDLAAAAQSAASTIVMAARDSVVSLLNLVLIPVFTFYFLRDFDALKLRPLAVIPPRHQAVVVDRARRMDLVVGEWIRGQVQVALLLAVLYAIGLSVIGLKLGGAIGIVAGLLNIVPYLGGAIGIGLSVVMALIHGDTAQLIGVGVVFFVVQMLEGYVITPRLVGEKVGMSPVTVMIVLLLGGSLFGFFGMLLSIPAVAAGSVLADDVLAWYRRTEWFRGGAAAAEESESLPSAD